MFPKMLSILPLIIDILASLLESLFQIVIPFKYQSKKSVKGKKVLITGSGSGLGRQLSIEFAKLGAELILWDINVKGNGETIRILKEECGVQAKSYKVDLSNYKEIHKVSEAVKKEFGNVDILINNAGICTAKYILECTDENIEKSFAVNVKSHFHTTRNFLPGMLENNEGHIVTIASVAGKIPCSGLADYCSSKHAAVGFHDCLSAELSTSGKTGIKTTLVCPYFIHTAMFDATDAYTQFPSLIPMLKVEYVAMRIVEAVLTNRPCLILPKVIYAIILTSNWLPSIVKQKIGEHCGIFQDLSRFNRL